MTGIKKSTLEGVVEKLVDWGWIEKKRLFSDLNGQPEARSYELVLVRIKGHKSIEQFSVPINIWDVFEEKLWELKRTKKLTELDGTTQPRTETYKDKIIEMDKRKRSRVLRDHSLTFRGKTKLVNSLIKKWFTKKQNIFYKILVFPYVIDERVEGHTSLNTEEMFAARWNDIPKKHEMFWREAAEELKQLKNFLS